MVMTKHSVHSKFDKQDLESSPRRNFDHEESKRIGKLRHKHLNLTLNRLTCREKEINFIFVVFYLSS